MHRKMVNLKRNSENVVGTSYMTLTCQPDRDVCCIFLHTTIHSHRVVGWIHHRTKLMSVLKSHQSMVTQQPGTLIHHPSGSLLIRSSLYHRCHHHGQLILLIKRTTTTITFISISTYYINVDRQINVFLMEQTVTKFLYKC